MKRQCQYIKTDGEQCQARPLLDDKYCYFHSPNISQEQRMLASSRGGKARNVLKPLPTLELSSMNDVVFLLADTINGTRTGEIPARVANAIGGLSNYLMRAIELTELETRIKKIEEQLERDGKNHE